MTPNDYVLGTVFMFGAIWALGYLFILACGRTKVEPPKWQRRNRWDA